MLSQPGESGQRGFSASGAVAKRAVRNGDWALAAIAKVPADQAVAWTCGGCTTEQEEFEGLEAAAGSEVDD